MLRGKIDNCGNLYIERAGRLMVEQLCPYGEMKNCGHHCPLFGEPFVDKFGKWSLLICGKVVVVFDAFLDERVNASAQDFDSDESFDPFFPI